MKQFNYYAPTKIIFGAHTETQVGELAKSAGATKVLVVYGGHSALSSGLIGRIEDSLTMAGLAVESEGGVVPNPLLSTANRMIEHAITFQADFILAVGGGSVIDTAKFVAHGTANPGVNVWDYVTGNKSLSRSLPVGAIPTLAAAGSETSNSAVITNDTIDPNYKRGLNTDFNRCQFAIMNPELTYTLPTYQIAAGAADIFMHTSERYFSPILGNHLTDELAEGLFRTIIKYGPVGVQQPTNYEAMSEIMWCGSISHVGLTGNGGVGDWACHQLSMALSALYNTTHGASLTAVWATWAKYVCDTNRARFAQFGRTVYGLEEANDQTCAQEAISRTVDFFTTLGMPTSLDELIGHQLSEEELVALAANCSFDKKRTIGSFQILNYDDMYQIYKNAAL